MLSIYNEERSAIIRLLSCPTTRAADAVPQSASELEFREESEFSVPQSARVPNEGLKVGYTVQDFDTATRSTWKFLSDADSCQIEALFAPIFEAHNRKVSTSILDRLFDPSQRENEFHIPVYGLYTGPTESRRRRTSIRRSRPTRITTLRQVRR